MSWISKRIKTDSSLKAVVAFVVVFKEDKGWKTSKERMPCWPKIVQAPCPDYTLQTWQLVVPINFGAVQHTANSPEHAYSCIFAMYICYICYALKTKGLLGNSVHLEQQFLPPSGKESQHLSNLWTHIVICDFPWFSSLAMKCTYSSI